MTKMKAPKRTVSIALGKRAAIVTIAAFIGILLLTGCSAASPQGEQQNQPEAQQDQPETETTTLEINDYSEFYNIDRLSEEMNSFYVQD